MSDLKKCIQLLMTLSDQEVEKVKSTIDLLYTARELPKAEIPEKNEFTVGQCVLFWSRTVPSANLVEGYIAAVFPEENECCVKDTSGTVYFRQPHELFRNEREAKANRFGS